MAGRYGSFKVNYTPMTYDDYAKPMNDVMEKHREIEDTLGAAEGQAALMSNYINPETDPETYKRYQDYMNELNRQSDLFSRYGLNPSSRRDLYKLNTMYNTHMQPIDTAYKRRAELAEEQRKGGNDMFYERNASDMSLDELIRNPLADYGRSLSGTDLTKMVADAAGALNKQIVERPQQYRSILGGMYADTYVEGGFSPEVIKKVVDQAPDADPLLVKLVNDVIASTGVENWISKDSPEWNRIWYYAAQGLWNAAGNDELRTLGTQTSTTTPKVPTQTINDVPLRIFYNPHEQGPLAEQLKKMDGEFSYDITNEKYILSQSSKYRTNYEKVYDKIEDLLNKSYDENNNLITNDFRLYDRSIDIINALRFDNLIGQIYKDKLDNLYSEFNEIVYYGNASYTFGLNGKVNYINSKNRSDLEVAVGKLHSFINDELFADQTDKDNAVNNIISKIEDEYTKMMKSGDLYDAEIASEFVYTPTTAERKSFVTGVVNALGNAEVYPAEYNSESKRWIMGNKKNEKLDPNNIQSVDDIGLSTHGVTANITYKDDNGNEKHVRIVLPMNGSINLNAENNLQQLIIEAESCRSNYFNLANKIEAGDELSESEKIVMQNYYYLYYYAVQNLFEEVSRLFTTNQRTTQKFGNTEVQTLEE